MAKRFARGRRFLLGGCVLLLGSLLLAGSGSGAEKEEPWRALLAGGQLVDIHKFDHTILVEMRYATKDNCVGAAIYPPDFPCLTRPDTAVRLRLVQSRLHTWGYRLKIWDAYRPQEAQNILYKRWAGKGFVANPDEGPGSLHTWGLAVDATMVDLLGHDVSMPSGFDVFTPEASAIYAGTDQKAAFHLHLLQSAMGSAGFMGLRNEWWHFAVKDWTEQKPLVLPDGQRTATVKPADAPNLVTAPSPSPKPPAGASARPSATPLR